jgi:general stress protein CsbA
MLPLMRCKDRVINYKSANIIALFYPILLNVLINKVIYLHRQRLIFFSTELATSKALSYPLV